MDGYLGYRATEGEDEYEILQGKVVRRNPDSRRIPDERREQDEGTGQAGARSSEVPRREVPFTVHSPFQRESGRPAVEKPGPVELSDEEYYQFFEDASHEETGNKKDGAL